MPWDDSDRRDRLPANWPEIRAYVLDRAGHRCEKRLRKSGSRCPREATEVDHRVAGDDHRYSNLQALCEYHHGKKSAYEGHQARAEQKAKRYRPGEAHPGAVR